jgi:hypothetical protein
MTNSDSRFFMKPHVGFPVSWTSFLSSSTEECVNCLVINHTLVDFKKVKHSLLNFEAGFTIGLLSNSSHKSITSPPLALHIADIRNICWSTECIIKARLHHSDPLGLIVSFAFHLPFQLFQWYVIYLQISFPGVSN